MTDQPEKKSPPFNTPAGTEKETWNGLPWIDIQELQNKCYRGPLENLMLYLGSSFKTLADKGDLKEETWVVLSKRVLEYYRAITSEQYSSQKAIEYNAELSTQMNFVSRFIYNETGQQIQTASEIENKLKQISSTKSSQSGQDQLLHDKVDQILTFLKINQAQEIENKEMKVSKTSKSKVSEIILYSHRSLIENLKAQLNEDLASLNLNTKVQMFSHKDNEALTLTVEVQSKALIETGKLFKDFVENRGAKERSYVTNKGQKLVIKGVTLTISAKDLSAEKSLIDTSLFCQQLPLTTDNSRRQPV